MDFDHSAYFLYPYGSESFNFPCLFQTPSCEFCGFTKVLDPSKITSFKQDFLEDLQLVFDNLVDVTENNPKYANRIMKQLKAYAKSMGFDKNYNPYAASCRSMPSCAAANPEIKQLYVNGHFCYAFKFGIITNGLGIIRHISFYNKDFRSYPGTLRGTEECMLI